MTDLLSREGFLSEVRFGADGLVPVIAQSRETGAVLMLAWMNRDTLEETLTTREVTYWSRSRGRWRKGETSGHTQHLVEAWIDCDGDALLMKVDQIGPACHTGAQVCFYRQFAETASL
jgi:phosphoribosyl-AMP cyclohydrolase